MTAIVDFLLGFGSLTLIIPSILLFGLGLAKNSHQTVLLSYFLFLPIFLILIFIEMRVYFLPLVFLPAIQIFYYFKIKNQPT
ncbi:hypothetical protein CXF70_00990 [Planomicrobium sp. MB-3u-38]|nr:hypothetical protein CXF70_00990 [Planomicrobium sp. MB-3u-38]